MQIYADNAATTKMSETALNAMLPFLREYYGNPVGSQTWRKGRKKAHYFHGI